MARAILTSVPDPVQTNMNLRARDQRIETGAAAFKTLLTTELGPITPTWKRLPKAARKKLFRDSVGLKAVAKILLDFEEWLGVERDPS